MDDLRKTLNEWETTIGLEDKSAIRSEEQTKELNLGIKKPKYTNEFLLMQGTSLLDSNVGDIGRLTHICKTLESKQELYNSDRNYLKKLIEKINNHEQNN